MPRPMSDDPRDHVASVRYTKAEKERADARKPKGMSFSTWVRKLTLGSK